MRNLIVSFFLLSCASLLANNKIIEHCKKFSHIHDPYMATVQSGLSDYLKSFSHFSNEVKYKTKRFKVNGLKEETPKIRFYLQSRIKKSSSHKSHFKKKKYYPQKARLVIHLAGIFNNGKSLSTKHTIENYIDKGVHVVVIPNTLSISYIKSKPNYSLGEIRKDAKVLLNIIQNVIHYLNDQELIDPSHIHLSGTSHGAFLASIVGVLGNQHQYPFSFRSITLFAPPYNLYNSIDRLDEIIYETKEDFDKGTFSFIKKALKIKKIKSTDSYTNEDVSKAKSVIANHVFKSSLIESVITYDKEVSSLNLPEEKEVLQQWKVDLNFKTVLEKYAPELRRGLRNGDGSLNRWLSRYFDKTGKRMRVLTSDDDFLNEKGDWDGVDPKIADIYLLKSGGHYGFVSNKNWIQEFLSFIF